MGSIDSTKYNIFGTYSGDDMFNSYIIIVIKLLNKLRIIENKFENFKCQKIAL